MMGMSLQNGGVPVIPGGQIPTISGSISLQNGWTPVIPGGQIQLAPSHLSIITGFSIGVQNGSTPVIPGGQMQLVPTHLSIIIGNGVVIVVVSGTQLQQTSLLGAGFVPGLQTQDITATAHLPGAGNGIQDGL